MKGGSALLSRPLQKEGCGLGVSAAMIAGYQILSQIGTGARSTIHKAIDSRTGQVCVLKQVLRQSDDDDRFIAQAEREHEICSQIDHKHLRKSLAIHKIKKWTKVKELYLAMEFVEGLPLEKARPNRLDGFLEIMAKVASGLHALHEVGYVHADIKPNNIILGNKGVVKIIDFGQGCTMGTRKERIQGTPDFIAPEQIRRMPLERTTDVYNLGATMYWVLTDRFYPTQLQQQTGGGSVDLVGPDQVQTPKEINRKMPAVLSQLVMECCQDNPAHRPADMMQVLSRLDVVLRTWAKKRDAHLSKNQGPKKAIEIPANESTTTDESNDE